jgi:hypothetical protein
LQTGQFENIRKIKSRIGYEKRISMDTNVLRQSLFLSKMKWIQTVINPINAEEIQLSKDIPEVGSNVVEEQAFPVDLSHLQQALYMYINQVNGVICSKNQCSKTA